MTPWGEDRVGSTLRQKECGNGLAACEGGLHLKSGSWTGLMRKYRPSSSRSQRHYEQLIGSEDPSMDLDEVKQRAEISA